MLCVLCGSTAFSGISHDRLSLPQVSWEHLDVEVLEAEQRLAVTNVVDSEVGGVRPAGERGDAETLDLHAGIQYLESTPIRNYQPPRRKERQDRITHWGETKETSRGPRNVFSRCFMERSEHRILVRLRRIGVMAVQGFFRIRVNLAATGRSVERQESLGPRPLGGEPAQEQRVLGDRPRDEPGSHWS